MNFIYVAILCFIVHFSAYSATTNVGIGGGGAMSGISFDPYKEGHLYVGTDMGLVYESFDYGKNWIPISQEKINFYLDLAHPAHMGFDPKGNLYWASGGCNPQMSADGGATWSTMTTLLQLLPQNCLSENTRIKYWFFSKEDEQFIGVGTTSGLFISKDKGLTWSQLFTAQESFASLIVGENILMHASVKGFFEVNLQNMQPTTKLDAELSDATMGKDDKGLTLVGVKKSDSVEKTVYIRDSATEPFSTQILSVGPFIKMAPNNSSIIYYTGALNKEGAAIWFSQDKGKNWSQRYTNDENAAKNGAINPNPIGQYVGYWDDRYNDFQVSAHNPAVLATAGNFFFKISEDHGSQWRFPYSKIVDASTSQSKESFWQATQLNPVSVYFIKKNPANPNMLVAGLADIGCILTLDKGKSWRMCNIPGMNSIYDIEFNPAKPDQLFAAASTRHDFPLGWNGDVFNEAPGGIYSSDDAGINWRKLTPDTKEYQNPYLCLAMNFKTTPCQIYAGTQGKGIVFSKDCGINWQRINEGFESQESSQNSQDEKGAMIIPKIKISPLTGEIYALHAGNRFWRSDDLDNPYLAYTGIYQLDKKNNKWLHLGHVNKTPPQGVLGPYWKYPIDFAVDWHNPQILYLLDFATPGTWKAGGVWFSADGGKSWDQKLQFDWPRKIIIDGAMTYVAGWAQKPEEFFLFKSSMNGVFEPIDFHLPLQRVDDFMVDGQIMYFATFGGGIFTVSPSLISVPAS